ncbi:MAG TPA: hypothetical protein VGF13_15405 [Verrucomicrobiae bacterium]|jgi:hypothetical protein
MLSNPCHSLLIMLLAGLAFFARASTGVAAAPAELNKMIAAVQTQELEALLQTISAEAWKCPKFFSAWHLANTAPAARVETLETQRKMGAALTMRLEQWAPRFRKEAGAELAKHTGQLLDLAAWVGGTEGYGNLLLAARCHDIACVGIGRLLVSPSYPITAVEESVGRLNEAAWRKPDTRSRVLNEEVGKAFFVLTAADTDGMERQLSSMWRDGAMAWNLQQQPSLKQSLPAGARPPDSALLGAIAAAETRIAKTPGLPAHLHFFHDDPIAEMPRPLTLARTWNFKWHEKIVNGLDTQNRYLITSLLTFRQRIRELPPDRAGFEMAWTPVAPATQRKLYAPAWRAYEALKANRFLDADAQATLENATQ